MYNYRFGLDTQYPITLDMLTALHSTTLLSYSVAGVLA